MTTAEILLHLQKEQKELYERLNYIIGFKTDNRNLLIEETMDLLKINDFLIREVQKTIPLPICKEPGHLGRCRKCGALFDSRKMFSCPRCRQVLDWSDTNNTKNNEREKCQERKNDK